jgi:hypothetical protein
VVIACVPKEADDKTVTINTWGGDIEIDGAKVSIPSFALSKRNDIRFHELTGGGTEAITVTLDERYKPVSPAYVLTPEGTHFEIPVAMSIDYDDFKIADSVQRLDDQDDETWEEIPDAGFMQGTATFQTSQSGVFIVVQDLDLVGPDAGADAGAAHDAGAP